MEKVFQKINMASKILQDPSLDISGAVATVKYVKDGLTSLKESSAWEEMHTDAVAMANEAKVNIAPPSTRHHRRVPQWLEDHYYSLGQRIEAQTIDPNRNYYNELLLPIVDSMVKELNQRFSDTTTTVFDGALSFSPASTSFLCSDTLFKMKICYDLCNEDGDGDLVEECTLAKQIVQERVSKSPDSLKTSIDVL